MKGTKSVTVSYLAWFIFMVSNRTVYAKGLREHCAH